MPAIQMRQGPVVAVIIAVAVLVLIFLNIGDKPKRNVHTHGKSAHANLADDNAVEHESDDPEYDALVKWLLKSGAEFPFVSGHKRAHAGGGRGLFATKDLTEGEVVIKIPAECWLSHRSILRASTAAHVLREDPVVKALIEEDETWSVVIGMEYERHNEYSPWKEYLHFMRKQESTIWWTKEQLEALHSQRIMEDSLQHQKNLAKIYERIYPHLFEEYPHMFTEDENTFESFTWAALTLWGRAFNVVSENSTGLEYGLIPIADLLNHDGGRRASWYVDYNDERMQNDPTNYFFEANRNTPEGQEVMISYGDKRASYNFMLFCGFIPFGQTYGDFVHITVTYRQLKEKDLHVAVGVDGDLDNNFVDELSEKFDNDRKLALEFMLHKISAFLENLPTTYANDLVALNDLPEGNYQKWATLTYRTRFKRIYNHLVDNLKANIADTAHGHTKNKHKQNTYNQAYASNNFKDRSHHMAYAMDNLELKP